MLRSARLCRKPAQDETPGCRTKQSVSGRKLIFQGHRWPAATAQGVRAVTMTRADGVLLQPQNFVEIVTTGAGRAWTPEPVDASWRDLAELDLADPAACQNFARRIGDPAGGLFRQSVPPFHGRVERRYRGPGMPPMLIRDATPYQRPRGEVTTSQWWSLAMALQQAAQGWTPPDKLGVSYPVRDQKQRTEAWRFLDQPVAQAAMQKAKVTPDPDSLAPAFKTSELDGFLVMQAWLALEHPLPMTRCQVCNSWFEIRRPNRAPRFCSASCRAAYHQYQKETVSHGIDPQEHHPQGHAALAGSVERARSERRHDTSTDKKLRQPKRGARARGARGAGDRRPRRR
jgi:hypothetical protein